MVKITSILMAALAAIAPVAEAGDCTTGLNYCGHTLLRYGDYKQRINDELGYSPGWWDSSDTNALFQCVGGGQIKLIQKCPLCMDNGGGKNDYCLPFPPLRG
ncbi:hypothetical protein E4U21_003589 [Claviceps maximensis]|nr:hypothetical protein E4U21_003589 [Claviceps maximensis]